jgi:uncharacterized membrane protein HdeD (DUF308 family)
MIELFLLLIGAPAIRRKWWVLWLIGVIWMAIGVFFFIDAFDDEIRIPPTYFTIPLLIDAAFSMTAAFNQMGKARLLRFAKAGVSVGVVLLIIDAPWHHDMYVGLLVGAFLVADAMWRATSAYVVRYARWRLSVVNAAVEFLLGLWSLSPWPTQWQGEVGSDVGLLLLVSAAGLCGLALRLRNLPPGVPLATILTRGWPSHRDEAASAADSLPEAPATRERASATVHVWTPTGELVPVNQSVRRYVVAVDRRGVVSTGHAALEAPPDIYISHYPAVEIDRTKLDFTRMLRATADNDLPGVFQPSYQEERAAWRPSTRRVRLEGIDDRALRAFWADYRRDTTYNLTNRNCSSAVSKALDAGLEGIFAKQARSAYFLTRLLVMPELWIAGVMRRRAAAMSWTPGIVLDYARALSHVVALPERLAGATQRTGHTKKD